MISILFVILFVLTIVHFVYESILLPTIRLSLRYKYFELRDELRQLRDVSDFVGDRNAIDFVENSINTSIRHIPIMNIVLLFESKRFYKNNPEIHNEVEQRINRINDIKDDRLKNIYDKSIKLGFRNIFYNNAILCMYFFPIALLGLILSMIGASIFHIGRQVPKLFVTPENQFRKLANYEEDYEMNAA